MSSKPDKPEGYVHVRTFFQHDRWGAHDHIGYLMANGVTQFSVYLDGHDWVVGWIESRLPNVQKNAEATEP